MSAHELPALPETTGTYPPAGLTEALEVALYAALTHLPDVTRAEVWGHHHPEGVFRLAAIGSAGDDPGTQARRTARSLLVDVRPSPEPRFARLQGVGSAAQIHRPLTDRFDLPRGLLVLTMHEHSFGEDLNDPQEHRALHRLAEQAQRAIRRAEELARADEHLRLAEVAREVVRTASAQLDLDTALENCTTPLARGFDALVARIRTYPTEEFPEAGTPRLDAPDETVTLIHRLSHQLWRAERAGQIAASLRDPLVTSEREYVLLVALMESFGWGRALLAPIGAGNQCLGHLILGRGPDSAAWSAEEEKTVIEIGQDLGRAVLNARAFDTERQLVDDLRELDAYKSDLIAMMSHHLRNPLAAIVGHVELTSGDAALSDEAQHSLDVIERGTQRLTRVVDDLLTFARVGDPRHPLEATEVDLDRVVIEVAEQAAMSLHQRSQRLSITHAGRPAIAAGDHDELDRLVSNLLSNAVKYTPDGGHISITTVTRDDEVEVVVSDEGFGISPEDQARLFTEFFRSTNPHALSQPGTGLGLAIVSRIVQRHLGRVELDSTLEVGSTFRVVLPSARAAGRR
ncbi:hypothetical protein GCM10027020_13420 [Nocardioides salsibiostraticola]